MSSSSSLHLLYIEEPYSLAERDEKLPDLHYTYLVLLFLTLLSTRQSKSKSNSLRGGYRSQASPPSLEHSGKYSETELHAN